MGTKQRVDWIDVAKGLGILFVILGHTIQLDIISPIYAFHMPLFFFLSGLVIKSTSNGFLVFLKRNFSNIMKPWILMVCISFIICLTIPEWRENITIKSIARDLYTANTNVFQNSSLWYLPCFFFCLCYFYFFCTCNCTKKGKVLTFFLLAFFITYIKDVYKVLDVPLLCMPFKTDSALIGMVFLISAYVYKEKILAIPKHTINILGCFLLFLASIIFAYFNGWANINSLDFGSNKLLYYPIAYLVIISVCLISIYICQRDINTLRNFLSFYGRNSLVIFGFQSLLIRLYLYTFSKLSMEELVLYGANPIKHQLGSFFIVTFIISPAIVFIFKRIRKMSITKLI